MKYGITMLSAIAIRKETSEQTEMVSQLLFGEFYSVQSEQGDWVRIRTCYDSYEGWISRNQHTALTASEYRNAIQLPLHVLPVRFTEVNMPGSPPFTIVAGSNLPGYDKKKGSIQILDTNMHVNGYTGNEVLPDDREHMLRTARLFLHTPYLWGGRSIFGCDCSGFVQTVFKIHNMFLPRDATEQANFGRKVHSLKDAKPCDLAFFINEKQSIHHVGMIISPEEIIHCSGMVKIDMIDNKGIFNQETRHYSHKNIFIRRYFKD